MIEHNNDQLNLEQRITYLQKFRVNNPNHRDKSLANDLIINLERRYLEKFNKYYYVDLEELLWK